ncbi:type II toxin-antitoxin system VapC family toxin [Devosia sp.]|uniref:type II toxin-antitoxin system VapC family toxin n=1 Tax=Devosia sp. TaxID=1871048 RepID=UPI00326476C3
MSYILDTNVVSETRKRRASPALLAFLASVNDDDTFISVMTLGELRRGVVLKQVANPALAAEFAEWLHDIEHDFGGRVMEVTAPIAHCWGELSSDRTRPVIDTLIAATAMVHNLTVVTRNERDYRDLGVRLLNPWTT